jgi:rod shape-determining protein MreB
MNAVINSSELAADIYNTGIYLAGGGSIVGQKISQKTDLPVYIAEDR